MIESASHATGSLLIWDTGEYEVLPDKEPSKQEATDDEPSDTDNDKKFDVVNESEKLFSAFQKRHIRLRLHGTRLPRGYTVSLRLPSNEYKDRQPRPPKRRRQRMNPTKTTKAPVEMSTDSDDEHALPTPEPSETGLDQDDEEAANASDADEDESIRANNAYPGATNSIGSVHQRHWFLTLDRRRSGFHKAHKGPESGSWIGSWQSFVVRGRDVERSILTGRSADEVMEDEGVERFIGRKMWRPITE